MPRTARVAPGGVIYHALNRGNRREAVFHKPADFDAFLEAIAEVRRRVPLDLLGYCLMPNHFHLVVRPEGDGDLGRWMRRLLTTHAQRYHRHDKTSGHVWQGRYKAFPVQDDDPLATVLRHVERNPLRAELVTRAEHWKWSSLPGRLAGDPTLWLGAPSPRDPTWLERVNAPSPTATSLVFASRSRAGDRSAPRTGRARPRKRSAWGPPSETGGDPGKNNSLRPLLRPQERIIRSVPFGVPRKE